MNDVIDLSAPAVDIDNLDMSCSLSWHHADKTRGPCGRPGLWEIQRNGQAMAFACGGPHLELVLGMVYSYEPDDSVFLSVVPMADLVVRTTMPYLGGTWIIASLRPVPIGCSLQERGRVTRDDQRRRPKITDNR